MIVVNTAIVQGNDDEEIDIVNVSDGEVELIPFEPIVINKDPVQLDNKTRSLSADKKSHLGEDFFSSEDEIESLIQDFREREYWEKEEQKQYWLNYEKKKQAAVQEWLLHPRKMKRSLKDSKEYKIFINSNIYEPVSEDIWSKAETSTPHVVKRSVLETPSYRELTHLVSYDENITKKYMDDYEKGYLKCDWIEPEINILRNYRKRKRGTGSSSEKNDKESLSDTPNSPKVLGSTGPFTKRRRTRTPLPEFPSQERRDERNQKGKKAKVSLLSPTTSPNIIPEKKELEYESETEDEDDNTEDICEDEDWAKYVGYHFEPSHWFDEEKELCKEFSYASAPSWSTISDNLARRKSPLDVRIFFEQFISSFMYCPQHAPAPHAKSSNEQPESPNCAPQLEPEELANTRGMRRRFFQDDAQVKLFKNSLHPQFSQLVEHLLSDGRARGRPPKKSPEDSSKKGELLEKVTKESLIPRCKKCPKSKSLLETLLSLSFHDADLLKININSIFQRQVPSMSDYSKKNVRSFFDSLLIAVDMCVDKKLANERAPELPENISSLLQQFLNGFSYCLTSKDAIKLCLARQELLNACRLFLKVKTQEVGQEYTKLLLTIMPLEELLLKMRKYIEELKTFRVTLLEQASERFSNFKQSLVDKKSVREQKG